MRNIQLYYFNVAAIFICWVIPLKGITQQYFSLLVGIGIDKVQYYENFHPVFLSGQGNEDLYYTPSWNVAIQSSWPLSEYFDIAISFSHLTITSYKGAVHPAWSNFTSESQPQGFIHVIPSLSYKPVQNFIFTSGVLLGMANPIDPGNAKETSNSFLNSDIALTNQFIFRVNNNVQLGVDWIEGLTYYDYFEQQDPFPYYSFFKYRSFIILLQYDLKSKG